MIYPENINLTIERLYEVPSTNSYLAQLCKESKAKEYSGGKGGA